MPILWGSSQHGRNCEDWKGPPVAWKVGRLEYGWTVSSCPPPHQVHGLSVCLHHTAGAQYEHCQGYQGHPSVQQSPGIPTSVSVGAVQHWPCISPLHNNFICYAQNMSAMGMPAVATLSSPYIYGIWQCEWRHT